MSQARKLDEDSDAFDSLDERAYEHVVDFVAAAALKDLERGREFAIGMAKALSRMPARPSSRTPTPLPASIPANAGAVEASGKETSCPVPRSSPLESSSPAPSPAGTHGESSQLEQMADEVLESVFLPAPPVRPKRSEPGASTGHSRRS